MKMTTIITQIPQDMLLIAGNSWPWFHPVFIACLVRDQRFIDVFRRLGHS